MDLYFLHVVMKEQNHPNEKKNILPNKERFFYLSFQIRRVPSFQIRRDFLPIFPNKERFFYPSFFPNKERFCTHLFCQSFQLRRDFQNFVSLTLHCILPFEICFVFYQCLKVSETESSIETVAVPSHFANTREPIL